MPRRNPWQGLWPLVALMSMTLAVLASGCLWGTVKGPTGDGVQGATVTYTDSTDRTASTTTGPNGWYSFKLTSAPLPGPVTFNVSAPGYQTITPARVVEYNDNPNASLDDVSSFWEIQNFSLSQGAQQPKKADLALIDLVTPNLPGGYVLAKIKSNGPDTMTNFSATLDCSVCALTKATGSTNCWSQQNPRHFDAFNPGDVVEMNTAITLDANTYDYDVECEVQVPFDDPNLGNNIRSEHISWGPPPQPTADLEVVSVFLSATPVGTASVQIGNKGPNPVTNAAVTLQCHSTPTPKPGSGNPATLPYSGPKKEFNVSLGVLQLVTKDSGLPINVAGYDHFVFCQMTTSVPGDDPGNNVITNMFY